MKRLLRLYTLVLQKQCMKCFLGMPRCLPLFVNTLGILMVMMA